MIYFISLLFSHPLWAPPPPSFARFCDTRISSKINKPLSGLLVYRRIRPFAARLSSKFHICPRSFASKENVYFLENLSVAGIILRYIAAGKGLFTECLHLFSFQFVLYFLRCIRRGFPQYFL